MVSRQAELAKLCAEVDQQRPLWEKSKQLEKLRLAEIAEVSLRRIWARCRWRTCLSGFFLRETASWPFHRL